MKKLLRPLALSAALGAGGILGTNLLLAQVPVEGRGGKIAPPVAPAAQTGRGLPRGGDAKAPTAANDSKGDPNAAPVKVTDTIVKTDFAVKPKDLSAAVKKGLEYLVKNQQEDGGWNQGGGWRIGNTGGGRVEGAKVEDPSDIGNTCFVLLALLRSGSTATDGDYKDAVKKGLKFVITRVEKSDSDSLYVTDVKGTQLQSKIGQYVDTFLVNLTLAEFRGKAGDQEKPLIAALEKTMTKIVKHQTADGGFAGNNGWAPTLSVGIANKGLTRARERGAVVDEVVLKRALAQSNAAAAGTAPPAAVAGPAGRTEAAVAPGRPAAPGVAAERPLAGAAGDAGVALYRVGQGAGNAQDIVNSLRLDAEKAKKVLSDSNATKDQKEQAMKQVEEFKKADKANDDVQTKLAQNVRNDAFVAGFGNNGGEEFLSFMNISESLVLKGGKDWDDWNTKMITGLEKAQDKDGSWQGHHCITGKTFCTAGALLVLMADRTPFPLEVIKAAREKKENNNDQPKPVPAPEKK
jgi:hypothetical protein